MESLYWINSLPITQCMLVDSVSELATPQATPILSDIILHVLNQDIGANGSKINMSTTYNTPQEHLRSAIQLLGQRVGWGNLAPDLFERNAADLICNGSSFVSPVEGSNSTNLLCSGLCSFQCAW